MFLYLYLAETVSLDKAYRFFFPRAFSTNVSLGTSIHVSGAMLLALGTILTDCMETSTAVLSQ